MTCKHLIACFFGVWVYFIAYTFARKAIVGGQDAQFNDFRYMVSLLEVDYGHLCGGAIIGERHILTAAHCFIYPNNTFKSKQVFALMGTKNLMELARPSVNLEVVKVYVPKVYNATNVDTTGDIAVLMLEKPMEISLHGYKRAYLPKNRRDDYAGVKAVIAGWGWNHIAFQHNQYTGRRTDSILRFATADVLYHQMCKWEHITSKISEEHLCARIIQDPHEIRGVCRGDDGGPLVHEGFVIGVLSKNTHSCSERIKSAIYTRVSDYLTFIANSKNDNVPKTMRSHVLRQS